MLTSRLKILPADKSFKKIITKDSKEDEDVKIFGRSWEQIKSMQQGTYKPNSINLNKKGDYGSDPLGGGKFKMIPSGDIVDLAERNRRLASKDANPDLINMYKQKFEEAIDNGDKEEMKRWFREIMNHVSFMDADVSIGKHNDTPDDQFDADELAKGIKVEMEHTDDEETAKAIAKDHLAEIKDYYTRLLKMEAEAKGE